MLLKLSILLLVSYASAWDIDDCECGRINLPVCGSDGVTYDNECFLKCAQPHVPNLTQSYKGSCRQARDAFDTDDCECGRINLPVCGSDGVTYDNECFLKCAQSHLPNLTQAYKGSCRQARDAFDTDDCECGRINLPVCGSDGVTYDNECFLKCAQSHLPNLTQAYKGSCRQARDAFDTDDCECGRINLPVCGSDGVTYDNECFLKCAQSHLPNLTQAYKGSCRQARDAFDTDDCECGRINLPVCGSDGVTYDNECFLKCAQSHLPNLTQAYKGSCRQARDAFDTDDCECGRINLPVCGSDGVTYDNECFLKCAQSHLPNLTQAYKGSCRQARDAFDTDDCECGRINLPVCGSDGVTYDNECFLKCAQSHLPNLTQAYKGSCRQARDAFDTDDCECGRINLPVCGSDGVTYDNECFLKCAQSHLPNLTQAYKGSCRQARDAFDTDDCECGRINLPVCGSDGVTYDNECFLKCAQSHLPNLTQAYKGSCRQARDAFDTDDCECGRINLPVCGSDGVTYDNECFLKCAQPHVPNLTQAYKGTCRKARAVDYNCPVTADYQPVCGSDGVSYPNQSVLDCKTRENPTLQKAHTGPCDSKP